jgi:gluconolactonase
LWSGHSLLFTDIPSSRIMRLDPERGELSEYLSDTAHTNGLAVDSCGLLYACQSGDLREPGVGRKVVRYGADGPVSVCDDVSGARFNSPCDLVVDPRGRVWFSDPRYGDASDMDLDHQSVYRVDPSGPDSWYPAERVTFDTTSPNGLLISPDGLTLYVAELKQQEGAHRELRAYPVDAGGALGAYTVLHDFGPHRGIDGMCLDEDGNIVAAAGWEISGPGAMIYVFSPTGEVIDANPVPVDRPTNCAFGGGDMTDLYVTTLDGQLLIAHTDLQGPDVPTVKLR